MLASEAKTWNYARGAKFRWKVPEFLKWLLWWKRANMQFWHGFMVNAEQNGIQHRHSTCRGQHPHINSGLSTRLPLPAEPCWVRAWSVACSVACSVSTCSPAAGKGQPENTTDTVSRWIVRGGNFSSHFHFGHISMIYLRPPEASASFSAFKGDETLMISTEKRGHCSKKHSKAQQSTTWIYIS